MPKIHPMVPAPVKATKNQNKSNAWEGIYTEIYKESTRKLNWRAMKYFIRHEMYAEAAVCRARVKSWNKNGPT